MPRSFDVVLFDLGHTLFYFDGDWDTAQQRANAALVDALLQSGYALDRERFLAEFTTRLEAYHTERDTEFFELSTETILRGVLADSGYPDPPGAHLRAALDAMYAVTQALWQPEEDARATLERLQSQGYRLGAVTNAKDEHDVEAILVGSGLRDFFEHVVVSTAIGWRKPHPRIFEVALRKFGVSPEHAVMVGDTLGADILGARGMGMCSVWITRRSFAPGNRAHAETIFPSASIAALNELPTLLEQWQERASGCAEPE